MCVHAPVSKYVILYYVFNLNDLTYDIIDKEGYQNIVVSPPYCTTARGRYS